MKKEKYREILLLLLILLAAELIASWSIWRNAPTDTIRVWNSSFWIFALGRLEFWVGSFLTGCVLVGMILIFFRHELSFQSLRKATLNWIIICLGLALEILTSVWYWQSANSADIRSLYGSIWYWDRVPNLSDLGWSSLLGYIWDHFLSWAFVVGVFIVIRFIISRLLWVFSKSGTKGPYEI